MQHQLYGMIQYLVTVDKRGFIVSRPTVKTGQNETVHRTTSAANIFKHTKTTIVKVSTRVSYSIAQD